MKLPDLTFDPLFGWSIRTRVLYKPGIREDVGFEMGKLGGTKTIILTDKGLVNAGVADMVIEAAKASGVNIVGIFDGIVQDAQIEVIHEGAALFKKTGADSMISIGGGSVIDTAKAIDIMVSQGYDDFRPLAAQASIYEGAKLLLPHINFPTTSGTGAEVTNVLLVKDVQNNIKLGCAHPYCAPDVAMLDPELTLKLPMKITVATALDALTHCIESFTNRCSNPISDALALHGTRLIVKYLPVVYKDPANIDARGYLLLASTMGGMAIVNSFTGVSHSLAHALGGVYGIPHGVGCGITLPHVMEFNLEDDPIRFVPVAEAMGVNIDGLSHEEAARASVKAVKDLQKEVGFTQTLKDLGIPGDREALATLIETTMADSMVPFNPRYVDEDAVYELIMKAR